MFLRLIQVAAWISISFLFMAKYYSFVCTHNLSIHLLLGILGFHPLVTMNNAAIHVQVKVSMWMYVYISVVCKVGIEGSCGNSV